MNLKTKDGRKGTLEVGNLVIDEIQENHRDDVRKLVENDGEGGRGPGRAAWRLVVHSSRPCRSTRESRDEMAEEQRRAQEA